MSPPQKNDATKLMLPIGLVITLAASVGTMTWRVSSFEGDSRVESANTQNALRSLQRSVDDLRISMDGMKVTMEERIADYVLTHRLLLWIEKLRAASGHLVPEWPNK